MSFIAVAEQKQFTIGVEDIAYYPLYDFSSDKEDYTRALFKEFARQNDYTFEYLVLPIKRWPEWLEGGQLDFKFPDNQGWYPSSKQNNHYYYSNGAISLISGSLVTKSNSSTSITQVRVLGTLLGFYPRLWVDRIKSGAVKLHEHSSTMVLVQLLLHGQIDALDIEANVAANSLRKLGRDGELVINKNMPYEVYEFKLSTVRHPAVVKEFNNFLSNNKLFLTSLRKRFNIIDHGQTLKP